MASPVHEAERKAPPKAARANEPELLVCPRSLAPGPRPLTPGFTKPKPRTKRDRRAAVTDHLGDCRLAELALNRGHRVVDAAMERAELLAVRCEAQRANVDPLDRVDGIDDFEHRERLGVADEREAPGRAPLAGKDLVVGQGLKRFHQVPRGGVRPRGNLSRLVRPGWSLGEPDDRPESILRGF